jgi:hypothetical protein
MARARAREAPIADDQSRRICGHMGLALVLLAVLNALAPCAYAQQLPLAAGDAGFWQRTHARAELGFSGRADSASSFHVVSPVISADYAFSHGFGMGVDWGFVLGVEAPSHAAAAWVVGQGDPLLKVWYVTPQARDRFQVYVGLSVPTAWLPRDVVQRGLLRHAYAFAAATRGLWNAWLWAPEQVTLAIAGRYARDLDANMRLVVDAAAAGGVSLSALTDRLETGYAQLAPALELHDSLMSVGLRVQAVMISTHGDPLQWGSGLYLRLTLGTLQLEAAAHCNLDAPLGVTGAGPSLCGAWLAAEVSP